jgi:glutaredoxin 3
MPAITMYTTQWCPYCVRAKNILHRLGQTDIQEIRIDLDDTQREIMMKTTNRRTVPQIFIDGRYVGDCEELERLDRNGELFLLLVLAR